MRETIIAWGAIALVAFGLSAVGVVAIVALNSDAQQNAVHTRMVRDEPSPLLANPIKNPDQWRVACPADGGIEDLRDEIDGGTHTRAVVSWKVMNPNSTTVNIGSGVDTVDQDIVTDSNAAIKIGTGATAEGMAHYADGSLVGWGCVSSGAATNVRVIAVTQ